MTHSPRLTYSILCCASLLWKGTARAADKPVSAQIHLSSPLEYQVFQRQSRNRGSVVIEGGIALQNVDAATGPVRLQFRLIGTGRDSKPFPGWHPLPFDSRVPRFRAEIEVPPGGWYRLETQVLAGPLPVGTNAIEHVGVGEVFVVAGQSNSANHGEGQQRPKSGLVSSRGGTGWGIANDPQPGASGGGGSFIPALGDVLAAHLGVPVGFICTGAGGTSVREWLPEGISFPAPPTTGQNAITLGPETWVSTGSLYRQLVDRSRAQGSHGFRAVLWHQGESDNNQPDGRNITPEQYRIYLRQLINHHRDDLGWQVPWFVAQASYHIPSDPGSPELRAAQKAVTQNGFAHEGPNTDALGSEYREDQGRGVHFNARGLERHGALWAEKLIPWLDQVTR